MKLSAEAQKLKKSLLSEYRIDDAAGLAILQKALEAFDQANECQRVVDKEGLMVTGDRGQKKSHPLLMTIRDCRSQFLMALKMLNLDLEPLRDGPGRPPEHGR
jgi:P27 family predicted phage terminase small subunit